MSEEQVNNVEQPSAPQPGSPEAAAHAAAKNPEYVPQKFIQEDGSVNIEAFAKSYAELEKQFHSDPHAVTADPVPQPVQEEAPAPVVEEVPVQEEASTIDEMRIPDPEAPAEEEAAEATPEVTGVTTEQWAEWKQEIMRTGDLSDESKAAVKQQLGLPDEVVNDYVTSQRAAMRQGFQQAADVVGGSDSLSKIFAWASNNLDDAARAHVNSGLASSAWETTLRGLESQYNAYAASQPKAQEMTHKAQTSNPAGAPATQGFSSIAEFNTVRSDRRYGADARFTQEVNERAAMTDWSRMR